ncbi:MAG: hypothetical protein NTY87_00655 [Planctomycetia bacterium]|nr:hypothetical protein [Planctomycetia bacterium]
MMGTPVNYHQGCPVCGRSLEICVVLLGRRVYCQHCGGGFVAADPSMRSSVQAAMPSPLHSVVEDLLHRATTLIEQAEGESLESDSLLSSYDT